MIRPYTPNDKSDIDAICKDVWDGNDYLPSQINSIHEDETCYPVVYVKNDKVVAILICRMLADDIVWLEGVRSHKSHKKAGYATKLLEYQLKYAKELGKEKAWLCTSHKNLPAIAMMNTFEFKERFKFNWAWVPDDKKPRTQKSVSRCSQDEAISISKKNNFKYLLGTFRVFPFYGDYFQKQVNAGKVFKITDTNAIFTNSVNYEDPGAYSLGFIGEKLADLETAINFSKKPITVFYPNIIDLPVAENIHPFSLMEKIL